MKWQTVFCDAIRNRKVLEILCSDGLWRTIEPHTYGINTAAVYVVSAYRTQKQNHPGIPLDWRMYVDLDIKDIRDPNKIFEGPRPGYNPTPETFLNAFCKF